MTDPVLNVIVRLSIDTTIQTPSRPGFGSALLMSSEVPGSWGSDLVKKFTDAASVAAAGFATDSNTIRKVNAYFGNNPRPDAIYIGRRQSKPTKKIALTLSSPAVGVRYFVTIKGVQYAFTATTTDAAATATSFAAAILGASGYTAAAAAGVVTLTAAVPGVAPAVEAWGATLATGLTAADIKAADTTVDPGIAADLNAVFATNLGGQAFGLLLDQAGRAEIDAADSWAQANSRFFPYVTSDDDVSDANLTTDIVSDSSAEGLSFTMPIWSKRDYNNPIDAGILGRCFPYTPGSVNFAHKALANVTAQQLTAGEITAVLDKGGNVYMQVQGTAEFFKGQMAGDAWADEVIGIAWLLSELQISLLELAQSEPKIAFTQKGVDKAYNVVMGVLLRASKDPYNLLDPEREISCSFPDPKSLTANQRKTRVLADGSFTSFFQGAINEFELRGRIQP